MPVETGQSICSLQVYGYMLYISSIYDILIQDRRIHPEAYFMATTRIDMRVDATLKATAEKAAALKGIPSLTEYVVRLIEKDAKQVIQEHESIAVKNDVFDRFIAACDAAEAPNKKLREAKELTTNQEIL